MRLLNENREILLFIYIDVKKYNTVKIISTVIQVKREIFGDDIRQRCDAVA